MEVAEKIRYFRQQRGMSQEQLAKSAGININTIRKYELGHRKPKLEQLQRIADGMEISVIEFLEIEIKDEADLIAMLKKISPLFQWAGMKKILQREEK
ncbi:MAG: helix-turn-helix transcriptional regulator [Lachnospiraceae bacterium]|nr:helix-turn-helix transcriptional regulator [Lachnospiraceae bacterium]